MSGRAARNTSWGDLTLTFGDQSGVTSGFDHFYSWAFGPPAGALLAPAGMATPAGISVGSTVTQVQAAYPASTVFAGDEVVASTISISEGLFGFVTTAEPDGIVTALLGGQGCGE